MNREFAYKFIEYPLENIKLDLSLKELESLKFDNKMKSVNKIFELSFNEDNIFSNIGDRKIPFSLIMTNEELNEFKNTVQNKKYLCRANIIYTENLDKYDVYNLEVFKILNPIEKWQAEMKNHNLIERINKILSILGINPCSLMIREKIIFIMRLMPLIQKKYLLLDFSTRGLGKSKSYSGLGYSFSSLSPTRANIFYNNQNKKLGEFFTTPYCFIIDEFQKVDDEDIFKVIQTYMDNDRDKGIIQLADSDTRTLDKSIVFLGNPRKNIDFQQVFANKINIFEGTGLHKKNQEDGDAFLSRVDAMLNSWGSREFSQEMVLNNENDKYMKTLLNESMIHFREYQVPINDILNFLGICEFQIGKRSETAIIKTFEGLIKLLYPEIFTDTDIYKRLANDFRALYTIGKEMRLTVDNMLSILKPNENIKQIISYSFIDEMREILKYEIPFLNFIIAPHRVIVFNQNQIIKIPLDTIGIKQNEDEKNILLNFLVYHNKWGFNDTTKYLYHDLDITAENFILISNNLYFRNNSNLCKDTSGNYIVVDYYYRRMLLNPDNFYEFFDTYGGINTLMCHPAFNERGEEAEYTPKGTYIFFKTEKWNKAITYNYLTGEIKKDNISNIIYIRGYSFYDLRLN